MKLNGWIGGVISFVGIAFLSLSQGDSIQLNSGGLLILLAAISESLFFVFQRPYLKSTVSCHLQYIQFGLVLYLCLFFCQGFIKKS